MMTASEVIEVLNRLDAMEVEVWLHGGWGVDALLCEQTRPHADLDLILRVADVPAMRAALAEIGFRHVEGVPESNFVLRDGREGEVDVHPVRFDAEGNGVYRMENGDDWPFPATGFVGNGRVADHDVKCLTADVEMLCHSEGYIPGETDFHDMHLLNARFGTRLLPPYDLEGD